MPARYVRIRITAEALLARFTGVKTCVIFNPAACGHKALRFRQHVAELAAEAQLRPTTGPGTARTLATRAVQDGFEIIVAAGGDGTLNEVLNGIGDVPGALAHVRLGLIPLGTANVLARELRIPRNFGAAWQVIRRGGERRIDLPEAIFHARPDGEAQRPTDHRFFAQLAGAGVDSRAIARADLDLKKRLGGAVYVLAAFQAWRAGLPWLELRTPAGSLTGQTVLIGNGRYYGGSFPFFPEADLTDGLLEATIFHRLDLETVLRALWGLATGRLYTDKAARHARADRFTLSGPSDVPLQLDGENVGWLPAEFTVRRQALRVIVP